MKRTLLATTTPREHQTTIKDVGDIFIWRVLNNQTNPKQEHPNGKY